MTKDYYIPQQDGVAGLEDFGDIEHGTNYAREREVYVDGHKLVGPCTEPGLVADWLRKNNVKPVLRWAEAYCSPDCPEDVIFRFRGRVDSKGEGRKFGNADHHRRGMYRWELQAGFPDKYRGPTKIARGALRFNPGWNDLATSISASEDIIDGTNELGSNGSAVTSRNLGIHEHDEG